MKNLKKTFPYSLLPRLNLTPEFSSASSSAVQGMGALVNSSHIVSVALSSGGGGFLTLFPCHRRQSCIKSSNMSPSTSYSSFLGAPAWSLPWTAFLQEQSSPACDPHWVQTSNQQELLSLQDHRFCQELSPVWASHGVKASFRDPCSGVESSRGCREIAPPWTSRGCQGTAAPPWSLPQPARGSLFLHLKHFPLILH